MVQKPKCIVLKWHWIIKYLQTLIILQATTFLADNTNTAFILGNSMLYIHVLMLISAKLIWHKCHLVQLPAFPLHQRASPYRSLTIFSYAVPALPQTQTRINSAIHSDLLQFIEPQCLRLKMLTYISRLLWPTLYKSSQSPATNSKTSIQFQFLLQH